MRCPALVPLFMFPLLGCAHGPVSSPKPAVSVAPERAHDGVLRLQGRFAMGHGCPVGPEAALTNGHVVDLAPLEPRISAFPYRYSDGVGGYGYVIPSYVSRAEDVAKLVPLEGQFTVWFRMASDEPKAGDTVSFLGYDWRDKRRAFAERVFTAKVLRVVAGIIVTDKPGEGGSSGACVLNSAGEVVALNAYGKRVGDGEEMVGGLVGVYGYWGEVILKLGSQ